tara:strand:- start:1145 stop:1378 length:234 start_codon:yes stop_codon:yes gene_type:complete
MKNHYRYWDNNKLKKALAEPLQSLDLDDKTINTLENAGIIRIGELLRLSQDQLFGIRNLGKVKQVKIMKALEAYGFY